MCLDSRYHCLPSSIFYAPLMGPKSIASELGALPSPSSDQRPPLFCAPVVSLLLRTHLCGLLAPVPRCTPDRLYISLPRPTIAGVPVRIRPTGVALEHHTDVYPGAAHLFLSYPHPLLSPPSFPCYPAAELASPLRPTDIPRSSPAEDQEGMRCFHPSGKARRPRMTMGLWAPVRADRPVDPARETEDPLIPALP